MRCIDSSAVFAESRAAKMFLAAGCSAGTIPGPAPAQRIVDSIAISQISSFRQNGFSACALRVTAVADRLHRGTHIVGVSIVSVMPYPLASAYPALRPIMRADRDGCGRGATRRILAVPRLAATAGASRPSENQIIIIGLFLVLSRAKWRLWATLLLTHSRHRPCIAAFETLFNCGRIKERPDSKRDHVNDCYGKSPRGTSFALDLGAL
jgi:hypothetical protein